MRNTVQRAYVGSVRVLVNAYGQVFQKRKGWTRPDGEVTKVPGAYERWSDVPYSWINACPYWS